MYNRVIRSKCSNALVLNVNSDYKIVPKEFGRNQRVAQVIKKELSVLMQREFPLNKFGMITLIDVDLSPDLKNATVYFSAFSSAESNAKLVLAMDAHAAQFRHELARLLTTRSIPVLRFKYDVSMARAQRLTDLLNGVNTHDKKATDQ